ncbi:MULTISPECIES: mannitol-1-phosphate 5-dehydrogenase [unclassified Microbacterium]|uniref:mannitol-1-phosphate 5-dehydrogenase n=1 Tax=unclassified Microbacterium TaxID=2609290 RepID=UPI00301A1538
MKAVHFGAGNIGRGLIGLVLHRGGYEIVFCDVARTLIEQVRSAGSYTVHEAGPGGVDTVVTGFRAIDSAEDPRAVVAEIETADVVTTSVGPTALAAVAPLIAAGLRTRPGALPPLQVMACENAIGATDKLRRAIADLEGAQAELQNAVFANTAIDRLVPSQPGDGAVDVVVEPFFEWTIESAPFGDDPPNLPGAGFVDDLAPYIERKLYTVNTGHATAAYFGALIGAADVRAALQDPSISARVSDVMAQTSAMLARKHGWDPEELATYRARILERFHNPLLLPDPVMRVGREPLRKLSRHERLIGPAAAAVEFGLPVDALVAAIGAAFAFDDPRDPQSMRLQDMLRSSRADEVVESVTGLHEGHPLFASVLAQVASRQAVLSD